jgi:hypothetical protein
MRLHATQAARLRPSLTFGMPAPDVARTALRPFLLGAVSVMAAMTQAGCMGMAELAYDSAAGFERAQCEKLVSMADRKACLERVNTALKQAQTQRNKP